MTDFARTDYVLRQFGNYVVQQSRSNLTKGKHNVDGELYNSIKYELKVEEDGVVIEFFMEDYGVFQDKGVRGVEKTYSQSANSPFSYKQSSNLKGFEYATGTFAKWAKFRGMQPRDKKGRFGSYKTMGYILANSIKKKGIKATMFFSKPFEKAVEQLPETLTDALAFDIEQQIIIATKK